MVTRLEVLQLIETASTRKGSPPRLEASSSLSESDIVGVLDGVISVGETSDREVPDVVLPAPSLTIARKSVIIMNNTKINDDVLEVSIEGGLPFGNESFDEGVMLVGDTLAVLVYCDGLKWHGFFMMHGFSNDEGEVVSTSVTLTKEQVCGNPFNGKKISCTGSGTTLTLPDLTNEKGAVGYVRVYNDAAGTQTIKFKNKDGAFKQFDLAPGKSAAVRGKKVGKPATLHYWLAPDGVTLEDPP